jgi:hypothetical protein
VVEVVESSAVEHASLVGQLIHYTATMMLGHTLGIGSSYLFAIGVVALVSAIGLNDYVLCRRERRIHLATYVILQVRLPLP